MIAIFIATYTKNLAQAERSTLNLETWIPLVQQELPSIGEEAQLLLTWNTLDNILTWPWLHTSVPFYQPSLIGEETLQGWETLTAEKLNEPFATLHRHAPTYEKLRSSYDAAYRLWWHWCQNTGSLCLRKIHAIFHTLVLKIGELREIEVHTLQEEKQKLYHAAMEQCWELVPAGSIGKERILPFTAQLVLDARMHKRDPIKGQEQLKVSIGEP